MRITQNTPTQLVVEDRPWLVAVMISLFVLIFFGVGLSMVLAAERYGFIFIFGAFGPGALSFWAFVRRSQAVFHAETNSLELRERSILGYKSVRHTITEIHHAEIETSHTGDNGPTSRIVFIIKEGQSAGAHPVTKVFSNSPNHQAIADTINAWLDSAKSRP